MKPAHSIRRKVVTIQSIAPIDSGVMLSDSECDHLSAILSDYIQFAQANLNGFDEARSLGAYDLLSKWMSQAADLRDKLEGR